jgi:hypothetical protein
MTTTTATAQKNTIAEANEAIASIYGQRVTMLIENSMGCIVLRHITLSEKTNVSFHYSSWKQLECLNLYYAMKGCRKVGGWRITQDTAIVLAKGWQAVDGMNETSKAQFTFDEWECFETDRFQVAKAQLSDVVYFHGC